MQKLLIKRYWNSEFEAVELEDGVKVYGGQRLVNYYVCDDTEENRILAVEHNSNVKKVKRISAEVKQLANRMIKNNQIFKE